MGDYGFLAMKEKYKPIMVGSDFYNYDELLELTQKHSVVDSAWKVYVNKTHMYVFFEKEFSLADPLATKLDPWNRPIRPWIYYEDDNPSIWQNRNDQHPSRNSMFMPTAPTQATHMAYTSIHNKWIFLYV